MLRLRITIFLQFDFFHLFFVQNDSYAHIFVFYRLYSLIQLRIVPITYLHGIRL